MGPRSQKRGNVVGCNDRRCGHGGFNGAALTEARKPGDRALIAVTFRHFNGAALTEARKRWYWRPPACLRAPTSMGPRSQKRGNGAAAVGSGRPRTSMGPRSQKRGNHC